MSSRTSTGLLRAYDDQLRREGEINGAADRNEDGPLLRARFESRGFVTYRDLVCIEGAELDALIDRTVAYFRDRTDLPVFEWKTRGHDAPPDLGRRLVAHGLQAEEVETVMVGEAGLLAGEAPQPDGVVVRELGDTGDLVGDAAAMAALQDSVFGAGRGPRVDELLAVMKRDPGNRWIPTAGDEVVAAGRLGVVPGTEFAGLWGAAPAQTGAAGASTAHSLQPAPGPRWSRACATSRATARPCPAPSWSAAGWSRSPRTTPYVWTRTPG